MNISPCDLNTQRGTLPIKISQADIGIAVKASDRPGKNTFVFGILVILMQIAICLLYAFLVWLPPYDFVDPVGPVDFTPIIITILLFFMVVLGNDIHLM